MLFSPYNEDSQTFGTPVKQASKKRSLSPSEGPPMHFDFRFLVYQKMQLNEMNVNFRTQRIRGNLLMSVSRNKEQFIPIHYLVSQL